MNNCGGVGGGGVGAGGGPYDAKIAGLYDLLDTLGSGHFAVVKLARHVFTGEKVAVKVIDKSKLDEVSKSHLFQEVRCMKLVQHPNVVRLYEVIDTQTKLYLILELGDGGDLYDYIMRHESGLSESLARDYFRQIVRAISYCHRLHVVHRDLKPENVVFFEKLGVVKLTDFGFSNKFCPGQKLETSCGSLAYSAPEILLGDSYDAPAVDVWSLGVILYMLVCGQAPFQEANDSETLTMIMDCKYTIPPHISKSCKRLIGRMLVREPEKRATLSEIATDPWVTAGEGITVEDFDTPLVAKEQLSEDDRTAIIQRMVNGSIATKEEILEYLEKNDYNHITATYYLLAERKLRTKRLVFVISKFLFSEARRPEALGVARGAGAQGGATRNLLAPPALPAAPRTPQDVPPRSRKCSIVREEEDDEEAAVAGSGTTRSSDARRGSRSEGRLHLAARAAPAPQLVARPAQLADNLTKVNLTEGVSGEAARRGRAECRRRRGGSCSSSDLSDDDSEKKKRAAEHKPLPDRARRDSHDDSSDRYQSYIIIQLFL
ncbi:SNF-related serine/threonine-protein kinase [Ostrinia furnacalis]|uniref:SNF-related serine/threonine-protein kinase n=1 Tax=Ostrinia furnacalis TaxID=93504 RepID=UPI00103D589C|nr:SNF-related serine/threonine-protein kinase [Ostrinia furnacalis]